MQSWPHVSWSVDMPTCPLGIRCFQLLLELLATQKKLPSELATQKKLAVQKESSLVNSLVNYLGRPSTIIDQDYPVLQNHLMADLSTIY